MAERTGLSVELRQDAPIPLDVAFACAPGELVALIGPSGAGKTTILRGIAGLYRPAHARVSCDGERWCDSADGTNWSPQRRRVGLVFQAYALFPHLTALRNVEAAMSHETAARRTARARELLGIVHLTGLEQRRPAELSGGEQQRVALARALAREPRVLLLDEPWSAVDRRTRRTLRAELAELRRGLGVPIVLVTHDLDEVEAVADRLVVIDRGRVIQQGRSVDVLAAPASERVRDILDLSQPAAFSAR